VKLFIFLIALLLSANAQAQQSVSTFANSQNSVLSSFGVGTTAPAVTLDATGSPAPSTTGVEDDFHITRANNPTISWPEVVSFSVGSYSYNVNFPNTRLDINLKALGNGNLIGDKNVMTLLSNGYVGIGTVSPVTSLTVNGNSATGSAGRAVNTGTTSDTIAAGIASTYESANSATTTLTFAAPTGDGERRRVCLKNASTVTWAVTTPATAVAGLPTAFIAGQCVEAVYSSTSGTPTNAAATTWYVY